jgi:hypothetical protein
LQDELVLFRKATERGFQMLDHLPIMDSVFDSLWASNLLQDLVIEMAGMPSVLSQIHERSITSYAVKPASDLGLAPEFRELSVHGQIDVLSHIERIVLVLDDAARQSKHSA